MTDWHDNDAFWEDVRAVLFSKDRSQQAREEVAQIVSLVDLAPGADVLDLACGPGRHALEFARRGFRVAGVDRTAEYLDRAKRTATGERLNVEWINADMRRFRRDNAFDLAVNLLTSFGYFADAADDRRVAQNLLASLKPGGHLVMDLMGKEVLARIFQQRDWHEEEDGTLLLEERTIKEGWQWIDVRWIIIRGDKRREHRFGHRLYSAFELRDLLGRVGFVDTAIYGSLKGTPYDHRAERIVVLAKKPDDS